MSDTPYSVRGERMTHLDASFEVLPEGEGTRRVWIADLLPHEAAVTVGAMMTDGLAVMGKTLRAA